MQGKWRIGTSVDWPAELKPEPLLLLFEIGEESERFSSLLNVSSSRQRVRAVGLAACCAVERETFVDAFLLAIRKPDEELELTFGVDRIPTDEPIRLDIPSKLLLD